MFHFFFSAFFSLSPIICQKQQSIHNGPNTYRQFFFAPSPSLSFSYFLVAIMHLRETEE
jgi:hypothetical protein